MGAPTSDRGGVLQTLRALQAAGWAMHHTYDGEDSTRTGTVQAATDAVMAVDDAVVHVRQEGYDTSNETGWVRFVLGNDPDEVVCDYTSNLESVIGPLFDSWDD